ncbi:MAG: penicillin-binding protein 1A [Gammaproteobacteria bacterium]
MLRFIFNLILIFFFLGILVTAGIRWYIVPQLPGTETLREVKMQVPLRVYSEDHSLISEFGEQKRIPVTMNQVPEIMIKAVLAAEDDRFFEHPGVDWQGILRAIVQLVKTGEKTQGGSTITMQVARNFFLSREKTYLRKLNEIILALKIEKELSKDEILSLYLNKIYLGQRAYGIAAAAQVYYGLEINQLTLPQFAMLAGLPKAPSTTNPVSNPERAVERRNYVLKRMLEENFISDSEYQSAINVSLGASLHGATIELEAPYVAEMVRQALVDEFGDEAYTSGLKVITTIKDRNQRAANMALRKALLEYDERHGYRGPEHHYDLASDMNETDWSRMLESFPVLAGLQPALVVSIQEKSITAYLLDYGMVTVAWEGLAWARRYISENNRGAAPKNAAEIVQTGDIIRLTKNQDDQWKLSQLPDIEGGLVSIRPTDGAIIALSGGLDFTRSKFNRITQAYRQPGSGFKPFIYSAALEAGYTAASLINDAPVVFEDPGLEDVWRPENYTRKTYGPTRLREALTHSRNLVSIRLLHSIGVPYALDYAARFGFDLERLPKNLSLALGSATVTPLQLARAYCVFANGGYLIEPYFIKRIVTESGEPVRETSPAIICDECNNQPVAETATPEIKTVPTNNLSVQPHYSPRVLDPENVWIMNSITRDVIKFGTARRALELNRNDLSGKTGTTNDQRDAWFSGYNSEIVAVAWVGFDKFLPLGNSETGARAALPMWIEYMRVALEGQPESIMPEPPGLVFARVDPATGKPAHPGNPNAIFEVFSSKNSPDNIMDNHPASSGSNTVIPDIQDIF